VAVAVAVLETVPASTSAWVSVYVAEHVTSSPGATAPSAEHPMSVSDSGSPVKSPSMMSTPLTVTSPSFVTTNS
jgi:hypothetical protein